MTRKQALLWIALIVCVQIMLVGVGVLLADHGDDDQPPAEPEVDTVVQSGAYVWELPAGFPVPFVPADNPMTFEKVELGRFLFYDVRLSANETTSCSTCHLQSLAFAEDRALAVGSTGMVHPRNSMSLTNVAYNGTYTWANHLLLDLEQQIPLPMFGEFPVEMGITGSEEDVLTRFREDARYQAMFAAAFPDMPDPFTYGNVVASLASFTRTLISGNSRYDQFVYGGDDSALDESEQRGMNLFFSEQLECVHCHTGFNFTLSTIHAGTTFPERPFFNTGLYNVDGAGAYPADNVGLIELTNRPLDMGRFRPPTLRNIALTAPYMHDGSLATLEDVIAFYADGGRVIETGDNAGDGRMNPLKSGFIAGFVLTDGERADLVNFLNSLTDEAFITDPRFSDPFAE